MDRQTKLDVLQKKKRSFILFTLEYIMLVALYSYLMVYINIDTWKGRLIGTVLVFARLYDLSHNVDTDGIS